MPAFRRPVLNNSLFSMYTLSSDTFALLTENTNSPFYWLVREGADTKNKDLLGQYILDARKIFQQECDLLFATGRSFTDADSERLIIMLKLLIDARKTWQEENPARATS